MKKRIDHFLLGTLWCLATVLGAMFWFDTMFGFNIFDARHWQYLGGLQASGAPVNIWFYVWILLTAVIMLGGLYLIIRPRFRKINIGVRDSESGTGGKEPGVEPIETVIDEIQTGESEQPSSVIHHPSSITARPPRLNLPADAAPKLPAPPPQSLISQPSSVDLDSIFTSAGYIVKKPPRIGGLRPVLLAIGPNESLWMGAANIDPSVMQNSVETLDNIFRDTLEDVAINIRAFIVNPTAAASGDIMSFDSVDALSEYIAAHPADKNENADDFASYSEYIDAVTNYFENQ